MVYALRSTRIDDRLVASSRPADTLSSSTMPSCNHDTCDLNALCESSCTWRLALGRTILCDIPSTSRSPAKLVLDPMSWPMSHPPLLPRDFVERLGFPIFVVPVCPCMPHSVLLAQLDRCAIGRHRIALASSRADWCRED